MNDVVNVAKVKDFIKCQWFKPDWFLN